MLEVRAECFDNVTLEMGHEWVLMCPDLLQKISFLVGERGTSGEINWANLDRSSGR